MNNFLHAIDGFFTIDVYYTDTDSLYIANTHWYKLDEAGFLVKISYKVKTIIKMHVLVGSIFSSKKVIV